MTDPISSVKWHGVGTGSLPAAIRLQADETREKPDGLTGLAALGAVLEEKLSTNFVRGDIDELLRPGTMDDPSRLSVLAMRIQAGATEATVFSNLGKAVVSAVDSLTKTS
jgi:hypothetical protein